jgi:hypothetical protein
MIRNPNHQPAPPSYAGYPPTSQPQQPLHVPFAPDPYAASRRDPFLPTAAQHARHGSQGTPAGENAPPAPAERQGGWTHTGTEYIFGFEADAHSCNRWPATSVLHLLAELMETDNAALHQRMLEVFKHVCSPRNGTATLLTTPGLRRRASASISTNLSWNMSRTRVAHLA